MKDQHPQTPYPYPPYVFQPVQQQPTKKKGKSKKSQQAKQKPESKLWREFKEVLYAAALLFIGYILGGL